MKQYVLVQCERGYGIEGQLGEEVLLVLKDKPLWQKGLLNLVGGKIEQGETPEQCAVREFKEETGLDAEYMTLMGKMVGEAEIIYCFRAIVLEPYVDINPREGETEQVAWHYFSEVIKDKRLIPNLRVIIPLMHFWSSDWTIQDVALSGNYSYHTISVTVPTYR